MITIDLDEHNDCANKSQEAEQTEKSSDFKQRLISQVSKHRLLYDNRAKYFSNVAKKELVWQQISKKLKSTVADCKDTWFELRYRYQRHARCLRYYFLNGQKEKRKRPAMYLESELMFLWRFVEQRKTYKMPSLESKAETDIASESEIEIVENVETVANVASEPQTTTTSNIIENIQQEINTNQNRIDDDLILVEQPVELIVIDDDDNTAKTENQFILSATLKLLVEQIKNYPELYDSEHASFKDYTRKSYIWNAIASNLGDKATKLMKTWIIVHTRYEWEVCELNKKTGNTAPTTELQIQLAFLENCVLNNPDTVYKQSYFLKKAWFEPIDYFKDIYSLIVRMKKMSDIVHITDSLLTTPEKSPQYISLWTEMASLKGCTAGQCEITWLTMRQFYWELMYMRQQNYQLTDKWYFETIITELYAISKTAQTAKQQESLLAKPNKTTTIKKATKRPGETSPTLLGAPAATYSAIPATSTTTTTIAQIAPTITNNLQNASSTNGTSSTTSMPPVNNQRLLLPKITAAISLAPQPLNTGGLQIKQISGPPILSPAPQHQPPQQVYNVRPITATPTLSTMSFNLPTQTRLTQIPMPALIRPTIRNITQPLITVRPASQLLSTPPGLSPLSWGTTSSKFVNPVMGKQTTTGLSTAINITPNIITTSLAKPSQSIQTYRPTTSTAAAGIPTINILDGSTTLNIMNKNNSATIASSTVSLTSTNTSDNNSQLPKITGATSLLNQNEILIELLASPSGNQLIVHGPPLTAKYQLSMPTVAKFIREILAIPLLHNKRNTQPHLILSYWEHISKKFNLPVNICRACWNCLLENFHHFPQIAPLKELMRPFQTSLEVWKQSDLLFKQFDDHCNMKNWSQYLPRLPEVVECISGYPVLFKDIANPNGCEKLSDMETLCVWRTIRLRFPKIVEIQDIWAALKICFCQYMIDLEYGIDNKWTINLWRSLARMKFLVQARYSINEPFYYIVSNKMVEEIERCAMIEMKNRYNSGESNSPTLDNEHNTIEVDVKETIVLSSVAATAVKKSKIDACPQELPLELGALMTAIQKYPEIHNKADTMTKFEAWQKVAKELNMPVEHCLASFKQLVKMYFIYKKKDPVNRCQINEKYFKKFDEIVCNLPNAKRSLNHGKIKIKTPAELGGTNEPDLVYAEHYIPDINMSNSPSNLVVKNWIFALGNLPTNSGEQYSCASLKALLKKCIPNIKTS